MISNEMNKKKKKSEEELLAIYNDEPEEYIVYSEDENNGYEEYKIVIDDDDDEEEEVIVEKEVVVEEKEKKPKFRLISKILNILLTIVIIILLLVLVDILLVSKFNIGPFFAIPVKTYNDGGTKEYYGLGYKVIKYNQVQGRRDKEIGSYKLKYNAEPLEISAFDLSLEFGENENKTLNKYNNKFIRINGLLKEYNTKENTITIGYIDEDGKYSIDIICSMATDKKELKNLDLFEDTTVIGTFKEYSPRTNKQPIIIKMTGCFAEQ